MSKSLKLSINVKHSTISCIGYINHQILPMCRLKKKRRYIVKNKCPHTYEQKKGKKIYFPRAIYFLLQNLTAVFA